MRRECRRTSVAPLATNVGSCALRSCDTVRVCGLSGRFGLTRPTSRVRTKTSWTSCPSSRSPSPAPRSTTSPHRTVHPRINLPEQAGGEPTGMYVFAHQTPRVSLKLRLTQNVRLSSLRPASTLYDHISRELRLAGHQTALTHRGPIQRPGPSRVQCAIHLVTSSWKV